VSYAVGSLVKTRGREWVVLPESEDDLLILRPLGGTEDEVAGICPSLRKSSQPSSTCPTRIGWRLSFLSPSERCRPFGLSIKCGAFRCFGKIAVDLGPTVVPLLLALKLDPVRLLIADDVGIGKTIEACLIARNSSTRECQRLAVLCPPQIAEQWKPS